VFAHFVNKSEHSEGGIVFERKSGLSFSGIAATREAERTR